MSRAFTGTFFRAVKTFGLGNKCVIYPKVLFAVCLPLDMGSVSLDLRGNTNICNEDMSLQPSLQRKGFLLYFLAKATSKRFE